MQGIHTTASQSDHFVQIFPLKEGTSEPLPAIDLSVFVACYNEEENITATLHDVVDACRGAGLTFEILVIDDHSSDYSVEKIQSFQQLYPEVPLTLRINEINRGLACNYADAAFLTRGMWYRLVCGDNAEPRNTLQEIFSHIGEAEIIIPYHTECPGRSSLRKALSRCYTRLVNLISGYNIKYYNGILVTRRWYVMRWHSDLHGFGFLADLVTRLLSLHISYKEIPVTARERLHGESKAMTFRNFCSVGHTLLNIFLRRLSVMLFPSVQSPLRDD
ncbi:MAG: hypothetical protein A3F67_08815 [Verrucomicrobia bacterium RIFCSPHIGHO2_12_FULL_41_10]|nr:MAG: hypothetical protein A3F67_08815 [Verrucomicrobia bacterium RIFCSPHIGHO2_12_FULL_41_10]HLB32919.1 glycosyltransferase [Chthoniobacterales bacterium]